LNTRSTGSCSHDRHAASVAGLCAGFQ
jgi:hypothetical protein